MNLVCLTPGHVPVFPDLLVRGHCLVHRDNEIVAHGSGDFLPPHMAVPMPVCSRLWSPVPSEKPRSGVSFLDLSRPEGEVVRSVLLRSREWNCEKLERSFSLEDSLEDLDVDTGRVIADLFLTNRCLGEDLSRYRKESEHLFKIDLSQFRSRLGRAVCSFSIDKARSYLYVLLDIFFQGRTFPVLLYEAIRVFQECLELSWVQMIEGYGHNPSPYGRSLIDFVRKDCCVPVDQFFSRAMHGPQHGTYTSEQARELIGFSPDSLFVTASLSRPFAFYLFCFLRERWRSLGRPPVFDVVEMGGGNGQLAENILAYVREFGSDQETAAFGRSLRYRLVELSPVLATIQEERLGSFPQFKGVTIGSAITDLPRIDRGVFLSNELVDMFPPKRIVKKGGQVCEVYVVHRGGLLQEVLGPLTGEAHGFLSRHPIILEEGESLWLQPAIDSWMDQMVKNLGQGDILCFDYGNYRGVLRENRDEYWKFNFGGLHQKKGYVVSATRWLMEHFCSHEVLGYTASSEEIREYIKVLSYPYDNCLTGVAERKDMTTYVDVTTLMEAAERHHLARKVMSQTNWLEGAIKKFRQDIPDDMDFLRQQAILLKKTQQGFFVANLIVTA